MVGKGAGASLCRVVVRIRGGTAGQARAAVSTSSRPPTPTDIAHRVETIAVARLRDQIGAIERCGATSFLTRALRPDAVTIAGAACTARAVALRLASFI